MILSFLVTHILYLNTFVSVLIIPDDAIIQRNSQNIILLSKEDYIFKVLSKEFKKNTIYSLLRSTITSISVQTLILPAKF